MKKILAISVALMYFAITSGLVLQIHYCMGRQIGSSVKFAETDTHTCDNCGMQNATNKCCHDEVKFVMLQDVHKQVSIDFRLLPPLAEEQEYNSISPLLHINNDVSAVNNNSPPDDDTGQPSLLVFYGILKI